MGKYQIIGVPTLTIKRGRQEHIEITQARDATRKWMPGVKHPDEIEISFTLIPENGIIEPGDLHEIAVHLEKYFNEIEL